MVLGSVVQGLRPEWAHRNWHVMQKLEFGQYLCLVGDGDGLGSWVPEKSLKLKWNEGDIWGAEVSLPAG